MLSHNSRHLTLAYLDGTEYSRKLFLTDEFFMLMLSTHNWTIVCCFSHPPLLNSYSFNPHHQRTWFRSLGFENISEIWRSGVALPWALTFLTFHHNRCTAVECLHHLPLVERRNKKFFHEHPALNATGTCCTVRCSLTSDFPHSWCTHFPCGLWSRRKGGRSEVRPLFPTWVNTA